MEQLETTSLDTINRSTYARLDVVDVYSHSSGYTDPGEKAALEWVTAKARRQPILDIGVGGGRTVPLLQQISGDYTGVDYTPALVAACRKRYPSASVMVADARNLSVFSNNSFFLVVFSFNGIDSVSHADRELILSEMQRVLMPGGMCLFSTHNYAYAGAGQQKRPQLAPILRGTKNPLRVAVRLAKFAKVWWTQSQNRRSYQRLNQRAEDYCMINIGAHDYGLMVHHIKLEAQCRHLVELGFDTDIVAFSSLDGRRVLNHELNPDVPWFHLVARKPEH